MTHVLDNCGTHILQGRDYKDEKRAAEDEDHQEEEEGDEDEELGQEEQKILTNSQHVQFQLLGAKMTGKVLGEDRANSRRKRCCSTSAKRLERVEEEEQTGLQQNQIFSKLGLENEAREGLQVHGSRIIRSSGRKDRHSKVRTSRGPRDRRVRLSAQTAIQFYDVQDRLGYDRPSKAIDWLIDKAKAAIEALAELPPKNTEDLEQQGKQSIYQQKGNENDFSVYASAPSSSNQIQQNYPPEEENSIHDLRASLQKPLSAPIFDAHLSSPIDSNEQALDHLPELNEGAMGCQFQGLIDWNSNAGGAERDGFFFNSSSGIPISMQQPIVGQQQHHLFAQRGPLQSSNLLSLHAWSDAPISINGYGQTQLPTSYSISSTGFSSGGFLGI